MMFFANYSTGYAAATLGGGSPALSTFDPAATSFHLARVRPGDGHQLRAWRPDELGDGALTTNPTLYRMDIAGYQDCAFDGTSFTIRNAGNSPAGLGSI